MIQALVKALRVLEVVAEEPETARPLGLIAARCQLNSATCAHILRTLVETGYVEQAGRKLGYTLGPAAHRLAARGPYRKDLVSQAGAVMEQLAARLGETIILAVLRGGRRLTLHEIGGGGALQVRSDVVRADDPYVTATGRLLLAGLPKDELADFIRGAGLPGQRWPEAAGRAGLDGELARIRGEGLAIADRGEVIGVAFPIFKGERMAAALGLFLPAFRFAGTHREEVLSAMREAAEGLSRKEAAGGSRPAKERKS
jgi:DNA-binding IclR family transcriptional regulator